LSTELRDAFESVRQAGLVPLPNVFTDPSQVRWPEDIFLVDNHHLHRIVDVLRRGRHPFARPLRNYLSVFESIPFASKVALAEYAQLSESSDLRRALREMFRDARELAEPAERLEFATFRGQPAASSRYFESKLKAWVGAHAGFRVVLSDMVTGAAEVPKEREWPFGYLSLCAGELRKLRAPPATLLHPVAREPRDGHTLRELGVFAFVAQRVDGS
jgi:hypothetical protein